MRRGSVGRCRFCVLPEFLAVQAFDILLTAEAGGDTEVPQAPYIQLALKL